MQKIVRLENWTLITPKDAPAHRYLRGSVFDHPRIADGATVFTTTILSVDHCRAQTANTIYILGKENRGSTAQAQMPNSWQLCQALNV